MPVDYWLHVCDRSRVDVDMYTDQFLNSFEKCDFFSTCKNTVEGKLQWNEWGGCSVSCGGGSKIRIANSCVPSYANCNGIPILEEPCNREECPDMPSNFLPAGTIVSWVPKPNKDCPDRTVFDDDTWIMCDGHETCKTGRFAGQVCSDLSDRVLVGAGKLGQMLDLKDATIPDHAHEHRHDGSGTYNLQYKRGPDNFAQNNVKQQYSSTVAKPHNHDYIATTSVTIDFSKMNTAQAFISDITNPKVSKSTEENNLYSPHMRVMFMFKCR